MRKLLNFPLPNTYKLEIASGKIAYWDSKPKADGNQPAIVFLHGHLTNKHFFIHQFHSPALAEYRLICMDLPGYGQSDAPNDPEKVYSWPGYAESIKEAVDALGLKKMMVIGWSLGGHVGLELTSRLPQLKGLLITGTPPIEVSPDGFSKGFQVVDPKILECFGKGNLSQEEIELLARTHGYDGSMQTQFIKDAIVTTDEGAKVIYPRSIFNNVGQNEIEIVKHWPYPIAVIAGEEETLINNQYIINDVPFANLWGGRVHLIPHAGHFVHMQQPETFNAIAKRFAYDIFK